MLLLSTAQIKALMVGATPATKAYLGSQLVYSSAGPQGLQDVVPSTCFHLEATDASSYDGVSQYWQNIVVSPADGSAQATFDHFIGNNSSANNIDPTFIGSAGDQGAYFSLDGGDAFASVQSAPGYLADIHRTTGGSAGWIAFIGQIPASGTNKGLWSTNANASTSPGSRLFSRNTEQLQFIQRGATANVTVNTGLSLPDALPFLVLTSWGANSDNTVRIWINARTAAAFTATRNAATTPNTVATTLGGLNPGANRLPAGSQVKSFAGGNALLNDAAAATIFDYFNALHGVTYA